MQWCKSNVENSSHRYLASLRAHVIPVQLLCVGWPDSVPVCIRVKQFSYLRSFHSRVVRYRFCQGNAMTGNQQSDPCSCAGNLRSVCPCLLLDVWIHKILYAAWQQHANRRVVSKQRGSWNAKPRKFASINFNISGDVGDYVIECHIMNTDATCKNL